MNRSNTSNQRVSATSLDKAKKIFKKHHGILRTKEILELGIHPRTLYYMRDNKMLEQIARGLFYLSEISLSNVDFISVAKQIPRGIICLISALDFYGLTTQIPHFVDIAYCRNWRTPKIEYPPIRIFRYSQKSYNLGIEQHKIDGIPVTIYSPEKTIVDCFKFRHKIGLNIAIEALKTYWKKSETIKLDIITKYADICRVEKIIRPYLESLINEH